MPRMAATSVDREAVYLFRMSKAEKNHLVDQARAAGLTFQQLLEERVLGEAKPYRPFGRSPKPRTQAEELPIAG